MLERLLMRNAPSKEAHDDTQTPRSQLREDAQRVRCLIKRSAFTRQQTRRYAMLKYDEGKDVILRATSAYDARPMVRVDTQTRPRPML